MRTFKYTINGKALSVRVDEKQGTIADILVDGVHPAVPDEEMPGYASSHWPSSSTKSKSCTTKSPASSRWLPAPRYGATWPACSCNSKHNDPFPNKQNNETI